MIIIIIIILSAVSILLYSNSEYNNKTEREILLFSNPKKKAQSIINNIEKGTPSESNIFDLRAILNKEPSLASEIASPLLSILAEM